MNQKLSREKNTRKLWLLLAGVVFITMLILCGLSGEVYRKAPPIPERIVTDSGQLLMTQEDILNGQLVWQSMGGQQVGSIWGHGAYQAPDWTADWLHREILEFRDLLAKKQYGKSFAKLDTEKQGGITARIKKELRTNRLQDGTLTISKERAEVVATVADYYQRLFGDDPQFIELRDDYALQNNALPELEKRSLMTNFFFWAAWATTANRPGENFSYTNNWPHEPLIGNHPTGASVIWSILSVLILLAGVGGLVWYKAFSDKHEDPPVPPKSDPMLKLELTDSMKAVGKYALIAVALFVAQTSVGGVVAHYTVEGNAFYGLPISDIFPYSITRTWHIQLGMFWIATAFLATGLFLAPAIGGGDPKYQELGVNVLFGALLLVVVGSLSGEWLAIQQWFNLDVSFYMGHQGYEYLDLGRFWQILLFIGLLLWLLLMLRALWPALKKSSETTAETMEKGSRQLVLLFALGTICIALFYGAGLMYGAKTSLTVMEYWRWWVVHLWVEGIFEVFATIAISYTFVQLGLVRHISAVRAILISSAIYLLGGIPGTFHHLYFSGTPVAIMAVGACFSALEVVPLVLIGFEAWESAEKSRQATWMSRYKWPIRFFLSVAFWNLVGAGLFGFLVNPPIALFYIQGLNTTAVHSHGALFGVYGMLSLGLILLIFRGLYPNGEWKEGGLVVSFWGLNLGIVLMIVLSLLPIGLLQGWASVEHGMWYARSADFLQQPIFEILRWLRMIGDTVFLAGVFAFAFFSFGIVGGWSFRKQ